MVDTPTLIRGGRIVLPGISGRVLDGHALLCDDHIVGILPEDRVSDAAADCPRAPRRLDVGGAYVSPGFINIHAHGAAGSDVMDGSDEALSAIGGFMLKTGVTGWLPTTLTAPLPAIARVLDVVRGHKMSADEPEILGVHLEGPFIDAAHRGAHDERFIIPPDEAWIARHGDVLKIVTYDPAKDPSGSFTRALIRNGIIPSLGHSGASCECALGAAKNGALSFTHIFNAMSGLHHREPGMAGAAFASSLWVELIADGIHVSPILFEPICKVKGVDRVILVTDSMRATGLSDGQYDLGGLDVTVSDGAARLTSSGVLAGSVLEMNVALRNMKEATGRPLWEIVGMATVNPANLLGAAGRKGSLKEGMEADLTCFDENFNIKHVLRSGKIIF